MIPSEYFLYLAAVVFLIGLLGFLTRKSLVQSLMCLELMLHSVSVTFVTFNNAASDPTMTGVMFALFGMVVGAAEIGLGLALVLLFFRRHENVQADELNILRG